MYRSISHFSDWWKLTYLGRKTPGGLSVRHSGGFSQWCLKQVHRWNLWANQCQRHRCCRLASRCQWQSDRGRGSLAHGQTSRTRVVGSRLNRWELTSSELRWGGGGRCAAGKVRPGHILLGQSRMPPLPPWLRQTTPFQSLRKSCLAYFDFGCILVWSLEKTYISHFR